MYERGIAAINLQMPDKIPHTEYCSHPGLVEQITGCSDGNFSEFLDDIAECGADGFIFEPLTDLERAVKKYGQSKVIIGNIDCRALTFGSKDDIYNEVKRYADLGKCCPGYFFAVGNHIPHNVPLENALYYLDLIRELGHR